MAVEEIRIPDIGGSAGVEVIEILVQIGDRVDIETPLMTLESDKATMEVPSSAAGTIKDIKVAEGDAVSEGDLIALVDVVAESASVEQAELATNKPAPLSRAESGRPEAAAASERVPKAGQSPAPNVPTVPQSREKGEFPPYASPSIRQLARELGVPLTEVNGSGDKGRITREDVSSFVKSVMEKGDSGDAAGVVNIASMPSVDFSQFGPIEHVPLTRIQKISGEKLHRNWINIPHVTNHDDADVTDLEAFRQQINAEQKKTDSAIKVTMVALLIKASVAALKRFPRFNASLDGDEMVLKQYYHIGFAADTSNGLVVPVLKDADKKGLLQIAREIAELSAKARSGKLGGNDMSGGCFSISSLGGIGGSYFTPIINAPEVAILGVGRSRQQMIWNGHASEPRLIMPLSLSWDHRAIDGAMAGRFNAYLCELLADFRRALL